MIWISIRDNGIGIADENRDKVFEMFQRLKEKSDEQGSGIGLAICKKIVDQHGGTIKLESQVGIGTTFTIQIPLSSELF